MSLRSLCIVTGAAFLGCQGASSNDAAKPVTKGAQNPASPTDETQGNDKAVAQKTIPEPGGSRTQDPRRADPTDASSVDPDGATSAPALARESSAIPGAPSVAPPAAPSTPAPSRKNEPAPVPSELNVTLIATMENSEPSRSIATIAKSGGRLGAYGPGDQIATGVIIDSIGTGVVYFHNQGRPEYLSIGSTLPSPSAPGVMELEEGGVFSAATIRANAKSAIECNELDCKVDRNFMSQFLANPALMAKQVRTRKFSKRGLRGLRLGSAAKGTVPQLLGLERGDVVTSINGTTVTTLDELAALHDELKSAARIDIDFTRAIDNERTEMALRVTSR